MGSGVKPWAQLNRPFSAKNAVFFVSKRVFDTSNGAYVFHMEHSMLQMPNIMFGSVDFMLQMEHFQIALTGLKPLSKLWTACPQGVTYFHNRYSASSPIFDFYNVFLLFTFWFLQ
jgi:hypothetical protein